MRILLVALLLIVFSCGTKESKEQFVIQTEAGDITVRLLRSETSNYLESSRNDSILSRWPLPYPVFRIEQGDVDGDGQSDIATGVIKATRRDSVVRKRLFLFKLQQGKIAPLWLGSSLSQPLEDFRLLMHDDKIIVRSIELEKSNLFLVAEYEWFGFGLTFRKYQGRDLSRGEAWDKLNQ